ncbi:hypothetical protein D3C85_1258410 [compost metagenome]
MKTIIFAALVSVAAPIVHADVGAFAGITYAFGSNTGIGFTLHATSTRDENSAIAAAGISYYPFSATQMFGIPLGIGYQGKNIATIFSYDILLNQFAIAGGYANTRNDKNTDEGAATTPALASTSGASGSVTGTGGGAGGGTGTGTGGGTGGGTGTGTGGGTGGGTGTGTGGGTGGGTGTGTGGGTGGGSGGAVAIINNTQQLGTR